MALREETMRYHEYLKQQKLEEQRREKELDQLVNVEVNNYKKIIYTVFLYSYYNLL